MVKKLAIGIGAVAASVIFAAPASANPDAYLNQLRGHGIQIYNPTGAVADGLYACQQLANGMNFGRVAAQLQQRNPRLNGGDAYFEVSAAQQTLC